MVNILERLTRLNALKSATEKSPNLSKDKDWLGNSDSEEIFGVNGLLREAEQLVRQEASDSNSEEMDDEQFIDNDDTESNQISIAEMEGESRSISVGSLGSRNEYSLSDEMEIEEEVERANEDIQELADMSDYNIHLVREHQIQPHLHPHPFIHSQGEQHEDEDEDEDDEDDDDDQEHDDEDDDEHEEDEEMSGIQDPDIFEEEDEDEEDIDQHPPLFERNARQFNQVWEGIEEEDESESQPLDRNLIKLF
jgi:hypothetical protein